jgi:glycosyltransferase involved in cell wall biosynthesis
MKVLLIVPSRARKGPVIVARDIVAGLVEMGHKVEVCYLDSKGDLVFPCPSFKFSWSILRRLNNFDVVHSHSLRPDALVWLMGLIPGLRPRRVCTIHNYVERDLSFEYGSVVSWIFSRLWRVFWTRRHACVVLTQDALSYYKETQPRLSLQVVYNGRPGHDALPIAAYDQKVVDDLRKSYQILGASALVTKRKGFDQILHALPQLPNYAFVLVGNGTAVVELRELAEQLGVGERFVTLGFRENARDFLPCFDVYVMPSHSEGMPLAMLEAACAAKPIVCSDIPVFREMFDSKEVDFFELNNTAALLEAVRHATLNASDRSKNVSVRFQRDYSLEAMARGYIEVYRASTDHSLN